MIRTRALALAGALLIAGCSNPADPGGGGDLEIAVDGRLERGAPVRLSAALDGAAVVTGVTWSALPAGSVTFEAEGRARLTAAGAVRIIGAVGDAADTLDLTVSLPPTIAVERVVSRQRDLWRMALDGGELARLTDDPAEDRWPSFAAGSLYFVSYRSPVGVYASPLAGGTAARVTTTGSDFEEAVVSPNGQRLAFTRDAGGIPKIFVSDRSGANARRLDPASDEGTVEVAPAWSPDGARIAYVTTASGNADIAVIPAAGGTPQRLAVTNRPEVEPAWSPDGARLVFVRALTTTETRLFVVDAAGGPDRRLTTAPETASEALPAFLADGRVVFLRQTASMGMAWVDPARPDEVVTIPGGVVAESRPVPLGN